MTQAEAIAAEVSARYRVRVDPAVVQIIPRGVSGVDIHEGWKAKRQVEYANRMRAVRLNAAKAHKPEPVAVPLLDGETRGDAIRRLRGDGCTLAVIAASVGISAPAVLKRLRRAA